MPQISKVHLILYVKDQSLSSRFYETVLDQKPVLDVPGMTEFGLGSQTVLGIMPEKNVSRLFAFQDGNLSPCGVRGEVYLVVNDPEAYYQRSLDAGARPLSPLGPRDWGDEVAYSLDADGYVLGFARPIS